MFKCSNNMLPNVISNLDAFYERFSDYVDAQIAQQKLKKIKHLLKKY